MMSALKTGEMHIQLELYIVHPESFRSNAQNANVVARRNRPRVERNDEFACVYLHLRLFASTVPDRLRTYIVKV